MSINQIVKTAVVTADRKTTVGEIAATMATESVGSVVVVEEDKPVGLVTDRKIALAVADDPDIAQTTAAEIMTDDLVTVEADTGVFDLVRTMGEEGIRRMPVVDSAGGLAGIVTLDDVLGLLAEEVQYLADVVDRQSPRF